MNTLEKRALQFCKEIEETGSKTFKIEWAKSKEWGMNPRIMNHGKKIAFATGCGYDKTSAVLADALQYLGETIAHSSGCGENSVITHCKKYEWDLERIMEDVYTIKRIKA